MGFVDDLKKHSIQFLRTKANNDLSKNTIKHYSTALSKFFPFLEDKNRKLRGKLTSKHLDENLFFDFIDSLTQSRELKNTTKKAYLIRLKIFFKYVEKKSNSKIKILVNFEHINIKTPSIERKHFSAEEARRLLSYFAYFEGVEEYKTAQKILIAKILSFTGVRASELAGLRTSSFNLNDGVYEFVVFGKGQKERRLYVSEHLIGNELFVLKAANVDFICATRTGKPMVHSQLWKTTRAIFEEADIKQSGIHIFRHSFARQLVEKNVNLATVMELLGHADIKTTQIYARTNENTKKRALMATFDNDISQKTLH